MGVFDNTDWVTAYTVNASSRAVQDTISTSSLAITNAIHQTNNSLGDIDSSLAQIYQGVDMSNEFLGDISYYLDNVSHTIQNATKILENISKNISSPDEVRANEYYRIARSNIDAALKHSGDVAQQLIEEAKELCNKSIELFDYNYSAHFDLGWIYSALENDPEKAEPYFERAILTSLSRDREFAILSYRNLFQVNLAMERYDLASNTISKACEIAGIIEHIPETFDNPELIHDLAFICSVNGDQKSLEKNLVTLMKRWPAYYNILSSESLLPKEKQTEWFENFVGYEKTISMVEELQDFFVNLGWGDKSISMDDDFIVARLSRLEAGVNMSNIENYHTLRIQIENFKSWATLMYGRKKEYDAGLSRLEVKVKHAHDSGLITTKKMQEYLDKGLPRFPL